MGGLRHNSVGLHPEDSPQARPNVNHLADSEAEQLERYRSRANNWSIVSRSVISVAVPSETSTAAGRPYRL